jgi:ankyrin repeat protein
LCGATFRLGVVRPDGSLDSRGFLGGTADTIASALLLQAPWLPDAREAERRYFPFYTNFANSDTTQLMRAAANGDELHARELLAAGVRVWSRDRQGYRALHYACRFGHAHVVAALLDAGAEIDEASRYSYRSGLILASMCCHEACVRLLLARGAAQNQTDEDNGFSAMHYAADSGHVGVLTALLDAPGAAAAARAVATASVADPLGRFGGTPLAVALRGRRGRCVALLRARGAPE